MYKVGTLFSIQWTIVQCKFQNETNHESGFDKRRMILYLSIHAGCGVKTVKKRHCERLMPRSRSGSGNELHQNKVGRLRFAF